MEKEIFELMTKMYNEMQKGFANVNSRLDKVESEIKDMKSEITKNSLLIEKANDNIKLLAEGQETIINQIGTSSDESSTTINNRLEVIELATKSTSKEVKFIKHKLHEAEEEMFDIKDHLQIIK